MLNGAPAPLLSARSHFQVHLRPRRLIAPRPHFAQLARTSSRAPWSNADLHAVNSIHVDARAGSRSGVAASAASRICIFRQRRSSRSICSSRMAVAHRPTWPTRPAFSAARWRHALAEHPQHPVYFCARAKPPAKLLQLSEGELGRRKLFWLVETHV